MNKFLAPNGKPSNLTPEQYKLVRTPEFKAWFGDWEKLILTKINDSGIDEISLKRLEDGVSKVVDSNGEPLVVFHTTDYLDEINVFRFNDDYSFQQWGYGIYFTNDKEHSESYFEGENYIVYEVFVNLKKPIITNQKEKGFNKKYFLEKRESSNESGAIIFHPDRRKWNYYIAGNPNQIKLADGTNTTFDAGNPDIRFEDGGAINKSNDFIGTWEELKKYNPNLWKTGILRRSQNPQGATDIIPKDVFIRQFQWQNYGQYDEIEAETIYGEPDNYGYYNDEDGNSIIDERTGNYLKDEFDYENNAERIKATISNKQLKNNLIDSFQTQEGKEYLKKVIATLPKNEDGTITAYRIGTIGEDLQSYTLSEGMAKTFSNQGTDIMPSGLPSIPNEGYKDYGVLPVNKVKINPKGIVAWSPYDSEILVELKYIKTDNSKNSYADGGGVTDSYKIEFIDDRVLINRNDFGLLEFSIKENELEIRRLYLNKENQRVGIGRKIIGELFNQNPDVNKIIVYPLGSSIPFWLRFTEKVREDDYFEITKDSLKKGNENYPLKNNNRNDKFNDGGETQINEEAQQYIDIISMNPKLYKYQKYKVILKDKFGIDFDSIYKDQEYIDNANLNDIKKQDDFLHFDNWLNYAKIISKKRGFVPMDLYATPSDKYKLTDEIWNETSKNLDFIIKKIPYTERGTGSGDIARAFGDTIYYTDHADFYYFLHELGHIYDFQNNIKGIIKNPAYSPTNYGTTHSGETFAENFAIYFINPMALKNWNEDVYNAMDLEINEKYKNEINRIMPNNNDITFENGGDVIVNPTEIECHTCHWKWKVKDGGDDLFICHKCYTDNTKYYKFEGLEGEKILDTISYSEGGDVTFNYLKNVYKSNSFLYHADFGQNGKITWEIPSMEQRDENGLFNYLIVQSMDSNWNQDETINKIKGEGSRVINDLFESYPFINSILYDDESEGFWTAIGGDVDELKREDFYEYYNKKYKKGGRTIAQTPAPKKDQIKGSDKNKEGSSKDLTSAKKIELSDSTIEAIKNKVDKHNEKHPKKKITIDSAKAVVRRGMGAYSTSYRPTISGGKPNSRVAWGLARLNAFLYKIVNGKSKSGKYSQDNDLIEELGYKVQKYSDGGLLGNTFTEIIYYAMLHTATTTDVYAKGKDLDDIQSEYNSISASDFDNPNSNYNSKMLESRINKYEFIGDDSLNAEDYIDDLENTDYWNLISDDYDIIESDSVFAINKSTDEMIDEIREFIKQEYNIGGRYAEKYMTISVDDENGDFIADLIIRTADHSQNVKNNDRTSFNLSFVIANKNETMNRFIPLGEEYYYDDNSDIEDVKEEIKGIIDDKIEYIKENGKKYEDGGDIQAYKEAMGISEFKEGGEANPKKIYVSIELKTKIEGEYPNYFFRYNEKPFEELKNGVLEGVTGVSSSTSNVAEWFTAKDCLIVMDYEKFMASNQTETINYNDPYQLMANKLFLFKRLYGNITRYGEQKNVYEQTLTSICPKIRKEIILEMEISEGEKYRELYRIDRFLDTNNTSAFYRWANVKQDIESPIDLTNAILEFNKLDDSYLGDGFENPVLTFNELLPLVELGIINAGRIWESEQEIILKNRTLVLPKQSQLFFINKDEIGRVRASNQLELVDKYKLKDLYKVYFVDRQDVEKYRTIWKKKYYQEKELQYEKSKYDLELKKDQVVNELFGIFINNSFKSFKEQYEKDYISDLSESRMFYDTESDDYKETYWQGIVLVQFILNEYIEIVQRNWKRFIESKSVENLNLYSFSNFYDEVKYELQEFFEKNKDELEKINDWSEIRGNGYLNLWGMEYLLKKSVYDYEDLPEWIDYKELSKMYLDKMGRELYRYYDKKDLPLISQYKDGGESDEPTHFWGTEAGGVLVYCSTTDRYLILLRSEWVLEPNTWGIISGKLDDDETNIEDAVLRESEEETGHKLGDLIPSFVFEKPNFKFHNFVSIVEEEFTPELDWENSDYKWVKLDEMPENLHFGLKLLLEKEDIPTLVEKNKNNTMNKNNPKDEVTFNIPLLIRFAELMREDIKTDVALHEVIENIIDIKDKGVLTMSDYDSIIGNVIGTEENTNMNVVEEEKMEEGGKVESIKSKKGDIKLMLDENWYSDDTEVELVPVAELIKFREYDRKVSPKYNKENSVDNINHLKFMFQKDGVKSPLIIEYSKEDNAVLIIEGNHRLNSAIDLGMEYLPARVVLKKYSKFTKNQLKNAMKVSGVEGNEFGYIPSNMKPSKVGIQGTKPIVFGDGGIIEGRLHSECDAEEGCGRKFQVGENGHVIEAERDEAVIVADAFQNNEELTIKGTPSEVASALNVIGGGKNFDKGAEIIKNGQELDIPELKKQAIDTDVDDVIDSGSIIINRRSMADEKEYEVTGTPKQIASAINSLNGNGVVIEDGAEIKEN